MATDEEIRAKDVIPKLSEFREGDGFYGDGQTSFFMDHQDVANNVVKDSANNTAATESDLVAGSKLPIMTANGPKSLPGNAIAKASEQVALTTYAQNVAYSIAPEFDPTRDSEHAYKAGESVMYTDGKTYTFTAPHYGAWNSEDVEETNLSSILEKINSVESLSSFPWSPEWANRSLLISSGDEGVTERLDRVCTTCFTRLFLHDFPLIIKASLGICFNVYCYGAGRTYLGRISENWVTSISIADIRNVYASVYYIKILAKNIDDSNIVAESFEGVEIVRDEKKTLLMDSDIIADKLVSQGVGVSHQSLRTSTGEIFGYNTKRLLTDYIPVERVAGVGSLATGYGYFVFVYDAEKKFINSTNGYVELWRGITQILADAGTTAAANGRYIRALFKHTVSDVDQELSFDEIAKFQINMRPLNSFRIELEAGSLSLNDGKFLSSSTTSEQDNADGFNGHWRSGKFIKLSARTVKFVFTSGSLTLFEYDDNRYIIRNYTVTSNTDYTLTSSTKYIKVMSANSSCTDIQLLCIDSALSYAYNEDSAYSEHSYIYQVPSNVGLDVMVDDDTITQYANNVYFYNSLTFKLPPNYKPEGKPVPLIFFCHGSHAMESRLETTISPDYQPFLEYLNAEGYAVLDCCSQSTKFADGGRLLHNSNPDDMACIASAIKWFTDNFNVEKDVYVMCKSRGGNAALSMAYSPCYRVKASALLAPSISCFSREYIFSYENTVRKNFAVDMGFDEIDGIDETCLEFSNQHQPTADSKKYVRGNSSKLISQCSTFFGFPGSAVSDMVDALVDFDYDDTIFSTTPRDLPVPTKIWIAPDDTQVSYSEAVKWQTTVKLGHGVACIRTLPSGTGGHHAVDTDENALKVSSIVTRLGITKTDVPLAYVESVRWFRQFE